MPCVSKDVQQWEFTFSTDKCKWTEEGLNLHNEMKYLYSFTQKFTPRDSTPRIWGNF